MAAKRAQFMDEQLRAGDDVSQSYRPYLQAGTGANREPEDRSRFPTAPGKMAQQQQVPRYDGPASHLAREMSLHAGMDLTLNLPFPFAHPPCSGFDTPPWWPRTARFWRALDASM
jgi:hypothetical protein